MKPETIRIEGPCPVYRLEGVWYRPGFQACQSCTKTATREKETHGNPGWGCCLVFVVAFLWGAALLIGKCCFE